MPRKVSSTKRGASGAGAHTAARSSGPSVSVEFHTEARVRSQAKLRLSLARTCLPICLSR